MPKTISDEKLKRAVAIVEKTIEPRIRQMVDEVNKFLAPQGIRVGVECQWLFDDTSGEPNLKEEDDDEEPKQA